MTKALQTKINAKRRAIAALDRSLISMLAQRYNIARSLAELKLEAGLPVRDRQVEREVFSRLKDLMGDHHIPLKYASLLKNLLIQGAIDEQIKVFKSKK